MIDVDPNFTFNSVGDSSFRPLQLKMEKTYGSHAVKLWSQHRGLLFRTADIGMADNSVHKSSAHWFPKPVELNSSNIDENVNGRFLLDLSNAADPLAVPVNGGIAKDLAINRYRKVFLPLPKKCLLPF